MSEDMGEFTEEPSTYIWRWTAWSSACVGIGALVMLMFWALGDAMVIGIVLGLVIAVGGAIGFGFVPRASLHQAPRPMTARAQRKMDEERKAARGTRGPRRGDQPS